MKIPPPPLRVRLIVAPRTTETFTTLLQGGFFLETPQGTTLESLLTSLPGFDSSYIRQHIQTIFINGLPADDLEKPLSGVETVVAVSAAMPGLAGAIFRKNGMHASLRTTQARPHRASLPAKKTVRVCLKLFNTIARERGEEILRHGCTITSRNLKRYLEYRQPILAHVQHISSNEKTISPLDLHTLLHNTDYIHLTIQEQS